MTKFVQHAVENFVTASSQFDIRLLLYVDLYQCLIFHINECIV